MHLSLLDILFWTTGFAGDTALLFVLSRRKRRAQYPIFTAMIALNAIRSAVLAGIRSLGSKQLYYFSFWSLGLVDTALQFSVVYEMAAHTFRPLGTWARDVRGKFIPLICLSLVIAALLTWLASPPTVMWIQTVVIKGAFFSETCMSELLVGMLVLSVTAGLPWKTHTARISLGLGIYSMIEVLVEGGHNYFGILRGDRIYQTLTHIRMTAYLVCLCYWMLALWPDEPAPRPLTGEMSAQLLDISQYAQENLRIFRPGGRRE